MKCKICGSEEIKGDCQYINGNYYHNSCIENLQQENNQLKEQLKDEEEHRIKIAKDREQTYKECLLLIEQKKELRSWLEEEIHNIVPEGCGINYNCEYDSEEDYVRAMEERSRLNTLKDTLSKLNELEGKNE